MGNGDERNTGGGLDHPATWFAPAGRQDPDALIALAHRAVDDPIVRVVLQAVGSYVLVLNAQRQILAASPEVYDGLRIKDATSILGLRPGELWHCENCEAGPDGCGTSRACRACGAVIATLAAQEHARPATDECHMVMRQGDARRCVDFRVHVTPLALGEHHLLVYVLQDISAVKMRNVYERLMFHDLRNMLGGLMGYSQLASRGDDREAAEKLVELCGLLNQEIQGHYILHLAENRELHVRPERTTVAVILEKLKMICENHESARGKACMFIPYIDEDELETDLSLLLRVLTNMVKNALEASGPGDHVHVWAKRSNDRLVFNVRNRGEIAEDVRLNLFKRGFSTKSGAAGRGLGTYSMKLLSEQYLGGELSFTSDAGAGTTFSLALPRKLG